MFYYMNKISIKKEKFTVKSLLYSLVLAIILSIIFIIFVKDYEILLKTPINDIKRLGITVSVILFFFIQLLGIIIHEIIHGLFSIYFTKDVKAIKFGFIPKYLIFYCHCNKPLYVNNYIVMVIAPFLLMGIIPFFLGIMFYNFYAILFGFIFTIIGVGDLYIVYLVLSNYKKKFIKDSPTEIGGEYV